MHDRSVDQSRQAYRRGENVIPELVGVDYEKNGEDSLSQPRYEVQLSFVHLLQDGDAHGYDQDQENGEIHGGSEELLEVDVHRSEDVHQGRYDDPPGNDSDGAGPRRRIHHGARSHRDTSGEYAHDGL